MANRSTNTDPEHAPVPKYLVPGLVAGLIVWGLYLAIGAAFPEPGPGIAAQQSEGETVEPGIPQANTAAKSNPVERRTDWSNFRPWRGIVVLACSAIFLAWFWGLQRLYVRRNRG